MDNRAPLKILHVVGAMNRAGTETMLMNIYRNINSEQVHFDFISYSQEDAHYDTEIKKLGGRVIKLSKTNSVIAIYDAIKRHGPYDAVHAHTLFHCGIASLAALFAGVKVRISHAHTTSDKQDRIQRKLYMIFMRFIINIISTNLLACSKEAGRYLFGKKALAKPKYSYFPNAMDYSKFLHAPLNEVHTFKGQEDLENSIVIGHIGRFIEAKNHLFLLAIMRCIVQRDPSTKLLLVGDGDLRQWIEEKAKQEGLHEHVRFVGIRDDIATLLHSMSVFVFPSLYEGLGLVLLEAQACGCPCIVSEAIQPEADIHVGLVTQLSLQDGPDVWVDKIIELANKKETNKHKIMAGFEKHGYSLSKGIAALMKLYETSGGERYERSADRLL